MLGLWGDLVGVMDGCRIQALIILQAVRERKESERGRERERGDRGEVEEASQGREDSERDRGRERREREAERVREPLSQLPPFMFLLGSIK